jgi:hypothetical protein
MDNFLRFNQIPMPDSNYQDIKGCLYAIFDQLYNKGVIARHCTIDTTRLLQGNDRRLTDNVTPMLSVVRDVQSLKIKICIADDE